MKRKTGRMRQDRIDLPVRERLSKTIRDLFFAVAIPSVMSGCAHHPPTTEARLSHAKRVFRVLPSADTRQDTYAATLPELSDSFSSAAIIEHIRQRHQAAVGADARKLKPGRNASNSPRRARPREQLAATGVKIGPKTGSRKAAGHGDHWETVRGRLVLADVSHELVDAQLDHLRQHPGAVNFLMKRAEPYLPYLLEEITRHGLPADLVLVPMVESAFETTALSPKQAAGIWQFIPSTGQQYGLVVSDGYDGRYDIHAATQAACRYLKHLNHLFSGDWMLAFAAYNAGEGAVQRAIDASRKSGGSGSFWELELPAETEAYVVKILSLAHAIADPASLGLSVRKFGGSPALTRVEAGPEVRIADLIASAGMPPEDFYKLNPAFKPDVEPPTGIHTILIPGDKAETLAANFSAAKVYAMRKVVVKKGETLALLAKRHGVPELKLAEWNNLNPKAPLKAGQALVVYPA